MTNLAYKNNKGAVSNIPINYIGEYLEAFLSNKSENTAKNYRKDITLYFNVIFSKEPQHVTLEDIESTTSLHASRFLMYLTHDANDGKGYKNASIKRFINAVRSFYKFLRVDFKGVNVFIFDNLNLKSEDLDSEGSDNIDWHEAMACANYALENRIVDGQMGMLIKLASITSFRLSALLSLEWEKHFFKTNDSHQVNYIETIDKEKKHTKAISLELFNQLKSELGTTGKLFPNLYPHKVGDLLAEIITAVGINEDKSRILTFHSFKKTGVNRVLEKTGNIHIAKSQGNHKSIATTDKYYATLKKDYTLMPSYTLDQNTNVVDEISKFTKEELLHALNSISESAKYEILRELNNL